MSWSVPDLMSIRLEFVAEALGRRRPFAGLCTLYGISEKTGYKWLARFRAGGPAALADASHAPGCIPHRTPIAVREAIWAMRRRHPTWGARKLRAALAASDPRIDWPAAKHDHDGAACRGVDRAAPSSRADRARRRLAVPHRDRPE